MSHDLASFLIVLGVVGVFALILFIGCVLDWRNERNYYKKVWKESNALLDQRFHEGVQAERERVINLLAPKRKLPRAIITHALTDDVEEPKAPAAPGTSVDYHDYWV